MRKIEYRSLAEVIEADANPKEHDVSGIADSIGRFGYVEPLVEDGRTGKLVAGHGRLAELRARQQNGEPAPAGIIEEDPGTWLVPVVTGWASKDDAEAEVYLLASNRTSELGGWDNAELLSVLERHEDDEGMLRAMGFRTEEVDRLRQLATVPNEVRDTATQDPTPSAPIGLREIILHLERDQHEDYERSVKRLRKRWAMEAASEVVLRAVRQAV